ncbi:hypothetical protein J2Z83_003769 [Virgibacillus natechei]|uniref:Replication protein n=1 Tax=Virgibacillus natechei TaxID=1216297 RepID=A0ABS4IL65_9BACI|nr:hypothetical protein [Virgibacillus natechei]MBP1971618.1 hypothetical protein [Virgibacillus natechei]UZD13054.1 hypothetical protein OLD84_00295 [Virgibacillus natechei]
MSGIMRVEKNKNFVVMDKTPLNDKSLSWKAKGIIAYMLSKPDDWIFYLDEVMTHSTDGEKSFRTGFQELKDNGYVKRKPIREGSRIVRWETIVYENPLLADFVHVGNEHVGNVDVGNGYATKNDSTKNELTKNDKDIYALYDHWNEQGIIKHKRMNQAMKSSTKARLEDYSIDELLKAIDNYTEILSSTKYYWTHKWTYQEFMKPNNVIRFLDEVDPKSNFSTEEIKQAKPTKGFQKSKEQLEHEQMLKEVGFFN